MVKKKLTLALSLLLFLGGLILNACAGLDCSLNSGVATKYVVKGDAIADTLTVLAVREGLADTTILYKQKNIKSFSLPMSYNNDQDKLKFIFTDTLGNIKTDVVTIKKTNVSHLESIDCPPYFFHTITGIETTNNRIDHIDIIDANVNLDGKDNFYIYFKPSN